MNLIKCWLSLAKIFSQLSVKEWILHKKTARFWRPTIYRATFSVLLKNRGVVLEVCAASIKVSGSLEEANLMSTAGGVLRPVFH